jgi:hypothetical protein
MSRLADVVLGIRRASRIMARSLRYSASGLRLSARGTLAFGAGLCRHSGPRSTRSRSRATERVGPRTFGPAPPPRTYRTHIRPSRNVRNSQLADAFNAAANHTQS